MYLNCHSHFSLRYGTLSPENLVQAAKRWGITTLALTDINNTSCTGEFIKRCTEAGIKPLVGIDFRTKEGERRYVGIARNAEGFAELNRYLTYFSLNDKPLPEVFDPSFIIHHSSFIIIYPKLVKPIDQFKDYDPNSDLQFPAKLTNFQLNSTVLLSNDSAIWFRPSNLDELLAAKGKWQDARLIGGNSEVGVEMNSRPLNHPNVFIFIGDLIEMRDVQVIEENLEIGVNITLTELINSLENLKKTSKAHHISLFNAFLSNLRFLFKLLLATLLAIFYLAIISNRNFA